MKREVVKNKKMSGEKFNCLFFDIRLMYTFSSKTLFLIITQMYKKYKKYIWKNIKNIHQDVLSLELKVYIE